METEFPAGSFDAIVSFYAIFHIPRQEHLNLFRRFAQWLRPGGPTSVYDCQARRRSLDILKMTSSARPCTGATSAPRTYEKFLTKTGFQIEQEGILGGGYESADALEEVHPFFFAIKSEGL